jgi:lipoprotein-anchoring transpeptidase ErfK/SrfK
VAIGQAEYPTPTGTYKIVTKQKNPTWNPPDSPWAEGLGQIPPGPGNPLGTRWIGTSAPAIGIHGTYADYSIGTAASHGCLRMHIPDVEELYEDVAVGMPVEINP